MGITLEKEFLVLISIIDIGGNGTKKEVLDNISNSMYIKFSEDDLKMKDNRKEIKWRNDLAFTRKHLQTKGYIDGSRKDNWEITNKGMEYLFELTEKIVSENEAFSKLTEESVVRALKYNEENVLRGVREAEKTKSEISSTSTNILKTYYESYIKIRIGQGVFKKKLLKKESCCKICGMNNTQLLIASHIKPWSKSDNLERLDDSNGFLLCPNHDALFDKGYITFDGEGKIIISSELKKDNYERFGINENLYIQISEENNNYLKWHRLNVFKK